MSYREIYEQWRKSQPELSQFSDPTLRGMIQLLIDAKCLSAFHAGIEAVLDQQIEVAKRRNAEPDMECKHCHHVGPAAEHTDRYFPGDRQNPPEYPGWWCAECNHFTRTDLPEIFNED